MKKYIHPKLLREANKNDCGVVSLISGPLIGERVSISEILALGFEPVKEETPEWIEKAYDYRVLAGFKDRYTFNKVILDNMPKQEQQKITMQELKNCFRGLLCPDICLEELSVRDMLDTKGLLE